MRRIKRLFEKLRNLLEALRRIPGAIRRTWMWHKALSPLAK